MPSIFCRGRRAFSIVELVVVIGIIAIPISMLPAAAIVRERANSTLCASNHRQLGAALNVYAHAWQGQMPSFSGWHTYPPALSPPPPWQPQTGWGEELAPYYVNPEKSVTIVPFLRKPLWDYQSMSKESNVLS